MRHSIYLQLIVTLGALCLLIGCRGNIPLSSRSGDETFVGAVDQDVLSRATTDNTSIIVDIEDQRAFLLVEGDIAATSPVSTARPEKETPRGTFKITERISRGKISNLYDVPMPHWMRLGTTEFGLHSGILPGYPASAGCIRMTSGMSRLFFEKTQRGTQVKVMDSWAGG